MKKWGVGLAAIAIASAGIAQTTGPADAYAGNWVADVSYVARTTPSAPGGEVIARTWGRIHPSGKVELQSDSGCQVKGLLQPKALRLMGSVTVSGCQVEAVNGSYTAELVGAGKEQIELRGSGVRMTSGQVQTFSIRGTFVRYRT